MRGRPGRPGCRGPRSVRRSPAAWACLRWPKPKALAGDRDLVRVVAHHLHADDRRRPALVELAGGVQEPGPEPEAHGHAEPVAQGDARRLEQVRPRGSPGSTKTWRARWSPGRTGPSRSASGCSATLGTRPRRAPRWWRPWPRRRRAGRRAGRRARRRPARWPAPCVTHEVADGVRRWAPTARARPGGRRPRGSGSGSRRRGRGGRRRRRRAARAARRRSGRTPVPSLPSDSATSCSIQSPRVPTAGSSTKVSLVAPGPHPGRRWPPRCRSAGLSLGGAVRAAAASASGRPRAGRRRRPP